MMNYREERVRNSEQFLKALMVRNQMEREGGEPENEEVTVSDGIALTPRPFDSGVAAGQIRLLADVERLAYVAVVKRWDLTSFLVIPFSPFSVPATEDELKLNMDGGLYLRTVQIWNARTLQVETLKKSWLVGDLPEGDLKEIMDLWGFSVGVAEQPPEEVLNRTGVPIYRRDDPRIAYRRKSVENFARIDAEDDAVERPSLFSIWGERAEEREEGRFDLAAAEAEEDRQTQLRVAGHDDLTVEIDYSPEDRTLVLKVWQRDLENGTSGALDGYSLALPNGISFGPITRGRLKVCDLEKFDGFCCLIDPEMNILILQPVKE